MDESMNKKSSTSLRAEMGESDGRRADWLDCPGIYLCMAVEES